MRALVPHAGTAIKDCVPGVPGVPPETHLLTITGTPLVIWILDRLSGECAPNIPGLFERALAAQALE